jgi:2-oxoglutarate dehydrogenase E2 component (dihydrolipoamide succinyltransferase)
LSRIDVELPKLGESIVSATITRWLVKEGDPIGLDEPLLEVATDKVNSEIPSPVKGTVVEILAFVDETVDVGAVIARIETSDSQVESVNKVERSCEPSACRTEEENFQSSNRPEEFKNASLSPAVLRLAQEHGLSFDVIQSIKGTGEGGRISKRDILEFVNKTSTTGGGEDEHDRVKMSALRKAIADNMVRSFYAAPHASLVQEVDVTDLRDFIKENKAAFLEKNQAKLTLTSFVAKAIGKAIQSFPWLNSFLEDDTIVVKKQVNLGLAVAVDGGVVVPVIRGVESLSLSEIAKTVTAFSLKAREGELEASDLKGGSITLTNFGMSGVSIGIPIIRFPEVAIVGLGAVKSVPAVASDGKIVVREKMHISLTFDHRVLDGMYGCGFLNELKVLIEEKAAGLLGD